MSELFFTADTHFGHTNIIKYCNRPFNSTVEHDEGLIENWNNRVTPKDTVFHLGDFCFGRPIDASRYINRLNGRIWFIFGNHDKALIQFATRFTRGEMQARPQIAFLGEYYVMKASQYKTIDQDIILMHYAMRVWSKSHHGAWHLYGHSHGSLPDDPHARSLDVGVDCHNYAPIEYSEIKKLMNKKLWVPIDHHGERQEGGGLGLSKEDYDKLERERMYKQLAREFT